MRLMPDETDLIGNWIKKGSRVVADSIEMRIDELITHDLLKIAISPECGVWETLYRDPNDGRYWELTYPHGEMHGGGPRRLHYLANDAATAKYRLSDNEN
jgi:Immunity protein 27